MDGATGSLCASIKAVQESYLVLREAALQLLPRWVAKPSGCADRAERRLWGGHIHATHTAALLVRSLKSGVAKAGHAAAAAAGHCVASL